MNEREIFEAALETSPEDRPAYLDGACGSDQVLRHRLEALLAKHNQASSFLETPVVAALAMIDEPIAERPGSVIGPYKLLEQIGEGGFGVVFMAEQQEPIRRKVALKVLKPGMDTRQVIARFEAERQALAIMDHPNIAKVLDAGQTSSGRPYFVMDLVKGQPITEYCDQNQLTPQERLELFRHVCQAVQHAHQKGIIHRDLKPSNVLVTLHDGTPLVKIIDFGIAKAVGRPLTDKTLFTGYAQMIGTPLYMSPEQAALSNVDVDTRSDIYSLGVLLYELLTGTTPFDKERLKTVGFDELRRIIREEEPPKPSTRMSTVGQAATTASERRRSDPRKLSRLFRGELDWIVMKALEKDRNRRYETASAFAADVGRYLNDEAVQACPPSSFYRLRKFVRRHKAKLAVALSLLVTITAIAASFGWELRDQAARRAATALQAEAAIQDATHNQEQQNWPEALSAVKRAEGILAVGANPKLEQDVQEMRRDLEMVIRLEDIRLESSAGRRGDFDFPGRGAAYAAAFRDYGIDLTALEPLQAAQQIRTKRKTTRDELIAALDDWAFMVCGPTRQEWDFMVRGPTPQRTWLLTIARAVDDDDWRNRLREAMERGDAKILKEMADSDHVLDLPASSLKLYGDYLINTRGYDEAVALLRKAQWQHVANFWINESLASWFQSTNPPQLDESIRFCQAALALRPKSTRVYWRLGRAFLAKGLASQAEDAYRQAIRIRPDFGDAHIDLAVALTEQGKGVEAKEEWAKAATLVYAEAKEESARIGDLGPDDARTLNNWAWDLVNFPNPDRESALLAVEFAEKAVEFAPRAGYVWNTLGAAYFRSGKWKEAITALEKSMEIRHGGDSLEWYFLAMAHQKLGHEQDARQWYARAVEWIEKNLPHQEGEFRRFRLEAEEVLGINHKEHEAHKE
jgi:serine/threonine protein kinase/uncharacterized protein HemY